MIDATTLTRDLIRCKSVTPADDGAQRILADHLQSLGFACTHLPFENIHNLFARRGADGPHFCFAGHTDVVPATDDAAWTHPPFDGVMADGKLYGRGAADMKGNIAAFIAALSKFTTAHPNFTGSISILITGDEEADAINGTRRVLEWMDKNGHRPDFCVVGEPSNPSALGDEIKIGRRGSLTGHLTIQGKQGHVAYPHLAQNPIPPLSRMINALCDLKLDDGNDHFPASSLQITNIHVGNTADNVIPARAQANFNIRYNDVWNFDTLEEKIRKTLNAVHGDYTLNFKRGANAFITTPGPYTAIIHDAVYDVTGRSPALTTTGGTSDARFISQYCPVVECGLINKTIHQVDEHCSVDDLNMLVDIYTRALERFFKI